MNFRRSRSKNKTVTNINVLGPKKWKFFIWGIVCLILGVAGWVSITGILAIKNISATNTSDVPSFFRLGGDIDPDELNGEGDSRINILFIGVGGTGHPGGALADTIQVASIDPINKTMAMLSLPRDLYVTQATGERTKLNAVYAYGDKYCKVKGCPAGVDPGGVAMKDMVEKVMGINVHYFARIDFAGFVKIVDALGGIQVNVEKTLYDPYYPDAKLQGYDPFYISAGLKTMNGATALKYARSRETTSDFDRARRQQQEVAAIREKALKINFLGNPKKLTEIITILGSNLRTDLKIDEMTKVMALINDIDSTKTVTKVLDTSPDSPLRSLSDPSAGYIIVPKKGINDYSEVHLFAESVFVEPYLIKEAATVAIVDGSGKTNLAATVKATLTKLGYNVVSSTTTATQTQTTVTENKSKPFTSSLLKKRFGATSTKNSVEGADITLTIGSKYTAN